jgi:hypothetical protein
MPEKMKLDGNGNPLPIFSPGTVIIVDGTSASAASAALSTTDDVTVRVTVNADAYLAFGTAPTATTSGMRIWAKSTENLLIKKGYKIAVLGGILGICIHDTTT